jgi:1,4-dihydroxy-2-naphthoyl-CoA hydrolase
MEEYDDEWFAAWQQRMIDSGGNVIVALGLRPVEENAQRAVVEMPMGPNVRQGTGVFAAGALIQLADLAATMLCFRIVDPDRSREDVPLPLAVQISTNLIRNTDRGKAIAEARPLHAGRTLIVVESRITDEDGTLLAVMNSTHVVKRPASG